MPRRAKYPSKKRIQPYISAEKHKLLRSRIRETSETESQVVDAALGQYLTQSDDRTIMLKRLNALTRQLDRMSLDNSLGFEFLHQWGKLWMANTPALPAADGQAVHAQARARYKWLLGMVSQSANSGRFLADVLPRDEVDLSSPPEQGE